MKTGTTRKTTMTRQEGKTMEKEMLLKQIREKKQYRSFLIERSAINEDKRTVRLSFSSEEPVERWNYIEILDHEPSSVHLRRLKRGGALLINHDMMDQVGVIEEVSIDTAD